MSVTSMIKRGDVITSNGFACPICGGEKFTYYGGKNPKSSEWYGVICGKPECEKTVWLTKEEFCRYFRAEIRPRAVKTVKEAKKPPMSDEDRVAAEKRKKLIRVIMNTSLDNKILEELGKELVGEREDAPLLFRD